MVPAMGTSDRQHESPPEQGQSHPSDTSGRIGVSFPPTAPSRGESGEAGGSLPEKTTFAVRDLSPMEGYKLATALIVPRPIGWIGTVSASGTPNLAPYSFFNVMAGSPPILVFAPGVSNRKDTLDNVRGTGEFTVNIVTEELAEAMNRTSADFPAEVDEFAACGLTAVRGQRVDAPIVGEARANFECRVQKLIPIGDPLSGGVLVIGEAVAVHVDSRLMTGTRIDQQALRAVGRHAGSTYSFTRDMFEMERPAAPPPFG